MRFMHGLRVVGVWGRLNKVRASVSYRLGSNLLANDDVDFVQREFIVIDHFDYYIHCALPKIGNLTSITTWYTLCLVRVPFLTCRKFNLYTVHYKPCVKNNITWDIFSNYSNTGQPQQSLRSKRGKTYHPPDNVITIKVFNKITRT